MNDLEPFWIFENEEGKNYAIERHIPYYPMSRESSHLDQLKKSLAVYRMAFGQARQEDLVDFIEENLSDYYRKKADGLQDRFSSIILILCLIY